MAAVCNLLSFHTRLHVLWKVLRWFYYYANPLHSFSASSPKFCLFVLTQRDNRIERVKSRLDNPNDCRIESGTRHPGNPPNHPNFMSFAAFATAGITRHGCFTATT